jgi:hypothetical protein
MVYNTQNYWFFGLCPSSGILETRKHDVSETGSVSVLRWAEKTPTQSLDNPCQSQSHIATDGQSVCPSWRRAPAAAHDQIFLLVWKLLSCLCGAPSLTRGRVCRLSVMVCIFSSLSFVQLFTILLLKPNRMYNICKGPVSSGSVQQTVPYF